MVDEVRHQNRLLLLVASFRSAQVLALAVGVVDREDKARRKDWPECVELDYCAV